jgi:hypothetical protein
LGIYLIAATVDIRSALAQAFTPDTYIVAGVTLRPFSVGHALLLSRVQNSFLCGEDHGLGDLLTGAMVCALSYEDAVAAVNDPERTGREIAAWQRRLSGGLLGKVCRTVARACGRRIEPNEVLGFDFQTECLKFESYLDAHAARGIRCNDWACPVTASTLDSSGSQPNAPEFALILAGLMTDYHMSEAEALDTSLVKARWLLALLAERRGTGVIRTSTECRVLQAEADDILRRALAGELEWARG